jgi:hypothetical protein
MSRSNSPVSSLMVLLACAGLMTACSDSAAPPSGPPQVATAVSASADTATRIPRGAGGQVANPRARLQAEFRKRPDFEEACRGLHVVSSRYATSMGCGLDDTQSSSTRGFVDGNDEEWEAMLAEADEFAQAIDLAWGGGESPYLFDGLSTSTGPLFSSAQCNERLVNALSATGLATVDLFRFGFAFSRGNIAGARQALQDLRHSGPAAVNAIGAYVANCPGGTPEAKQPR